jgi:hypothetical protein
MFVPFVHLFRRRRSYKVKHFVFEGKITSLCEKDHCHVDDVGIVVPYDVHVGRRFAVFQLCPEYKVWRTTHHMSVTLKMHRTRCQRLESN